ncbi:MAG TPA: hypothetical protein VGD65_16205 [Chryseosolibacter sp.]
MGQYIAALTLVTVFITMNSAFGQESKLGVYITVKYSKKCENPAVNIENKKFCLAPQPVLTKIDLAYMTEIKLDLAMQKYFTLVFTENGAEKLRNLAIGFPNTQIVLVVDDLIIGFLKDLDQLRSNSLKMTAGIQYGNNVEFVHEKLKAFVPVKK